MQGRHSHATGSDAHPPTAPHAAVQSALHEVYTAMPGATKASATRELVSRSTDGRLQAATAAAAVASLGTGVARRIREEHMLAVVVKEPASFVEAMGIADVKASVDGDVLIAVGGHGACEVVVMASRPELRQIISDNIVGMVR